MQCNKCKKEIVPKDLHYCKFLSLNGETIFYCTTCSKNIDLQNVYTEPRSIEEDLILAIDSLRMKK